MKSHSFVKAALLAGSALTASITTAADKTAPVPVPALITSRAEHGLLLGIATAGPQVVAVGGHGVILRSGDGVRWTQVNSPVDSALNQVAFADARQGWAVGHDGVILHTVDGGASWTLQNFQPQVFAPLFAIQPLDSQQAIAVGAFGTIKQTIDGGQHWTDIAVPEISGDKYHLNTITRLHDGRLLVAGERGLVGLSPDGQQWTRVQTPYEGSLFGALPMGEHGALVFGMRGNLYYAEAPETGQWKKLETNTTTSLFGGGLLGRDAAMLVGADGALLRVDGQTQQVQRMHIDTLDADQTLAAAQLVQGSLIVVGDKGVSRIAWPR